VRYQTRLYVTLRDCGDADAARAAMAGATAALDPLYERDAIAGYHLSVIEHEDDFEEKDLDRPLLESGTGGVLPALYLNLTYRIDQGPPDDAAAAPTLAAYGFRHLLTESDE